MTHIELSSTKIVWVDLTLKTMGAEAEQDMLILWREFLQWQLDNNILPIAKGHSGVLGFSGGFSEANAKKVLRWLRPRLAAPKRKASEPIRRKRGMPPVVKS